MPPPGPGGSSVRPLGHNAVVLLTELVLTSQAVAATPRRSVKIDEIARLLRTASPAEVPVVVAFLSGELLQRQIGVGYAALGGLLTRDGAAGETAPALTVSEVDAAFAEVGAVTGAGAQAARRRLLAEPVRPGHRGRTRLPGPAARRGTAPGRAGRGDGRGGRAGRRGAGRRGQAGAPARRFPARGGGGRPPRGRMPPTAASAALRSFRPAGRTAAAADAGRRPRRSVAAAFARVSPAAVEWKIDGIRIQVHREATRSPCSPGPSTTSPRGCPRSPRPCSRSPPGRPGPGR